MPPFLVPAQSPSPEAGTAQRASKMKGFKLRDTCISCPSMCSYSPVEKNDEADLFCCLLLLRFS